MLENWKEFFLDAGISTANADIYSSIFKKHLIREPVLPELNENRLEKMGITAMGDILSILLHLRKLYQKVNEVYHSKFTFLSFRVFKLYHCYISLQTEKDEKVTAGRSSEIQVCT